MIGSDENGVFNTQDQISDLNKKIHLIEADLSAYKENCLLTNQRNYSKIHNLRKENKELHKALAKKLKADENVIEQAFENAENQIAQKRKTNDTNKKAMKSMRIRSADTVERTALRNKSGEVASEIINQSLCDQKKRLNAMKAETNKKKQMLNDLQTTYDQLVKEASFAVETSKGESKAAQA